MRVRVLQEAGVSRAASLKKFVQRSVVFWEALKYPRHSFSFAPCSRPSISHRDDFRREGKAEMKTHFCSQSAAGRELNWCYILPRKPRSLDTVFNTVKLIAAELNMSEANDDPHVFAIAKCLPDVIPQTWSIKLIFPRISELPSFYPAESS